MSTREKIILGLLIGITIYSMSISYQKDKILEQKQKIEEKILIEKQKIPEIVKIKRELIKTTKEKEKLLKEREENWNKLQKAIWKERCLKQKGEEELKGESKTECNKNLERFAVKY